jgi:hypothetical protein
VIRGPSAIELIAVAVIILAATNVFKACDSRETHQRIDLLEQRITHLEPPPSRTVLHGRYPLGIDREGREIW